MFEFVLYLSQGAMMPDPWIETHKVTEVVHEVPDEIEPLSFHPYNCHMCRKGH